MRPGLLLRLILILFCATFSKKKSFTCTVITFVEELHYKIYFLKVMVQTEYKILSRENNLAIS